MAKNAARRQTFADLVKEPTWSQTEASRGGRYAARPGRFNGAGEFFDPAGQRLLLREDDIEVEEAQRLVDGGALVVAESCGCGGWYGDCTPEWLTDEQLRGLRNGPDPRFTGRHDVPTWIDVWAGEGGAVVFAHGDVSWGAALR
jgi:hypothetical protein